MATVRQSAGHAISHFFTVFVPLAFLMNVFFPVQNVFRKLWWKAWGHNPDENIGFHLDKLSFDHNWHNRAVITQIVAGMAKLFYSDPMTSIAVKMYNDYRFHQYQPYDVWAPIDVWAQLEQPGKAIIDWFIDVEGMPRSRLDYMLKSNPNFVEWYTEAIETKMLDEEGYEALKASNKAKREAECTVP
jgi:hypothetical protein